MNQVARHPVTDVGPAPKRWLEFARASASGAHAWRLVGGWRVWTLTPGETFLRAPFYGTPWPEASVVATCQCRPRRHNPLDLLHHSACHKGIHALDDPWAAIAEGNRLRALLDLNRLSEVVVLGVVELLGLITGGHSWEFAPTGRGVRDPGHRRRRSAPLHPSGLVRRDRRRRCARKPGRHIRARPGRRSATSSGAGP
ncbi:MAG: hypothetical protein JWP83_2681 [Mycobacterium sp.]|nr:hypothetical protein [Mycobacterium sp.]